MHAWFLFQHIALCDDNHFTVVVSHYSLGPLPNTVGTFIAIEIEMDQIKQEGKVDIAGIVTRLRQQRIKMVQTSVSD